MVGTKVREQPDTRQDVLVAPPSEVAAARATGDEDFDALESIISVRDLDFFYGKEQALFDNHLEIKKNRVTAVIGPSGCGKSTHIRTYNRIYELYRDHKATGEILFGGRNVLAPGTDLLDLRRRIGMIFQKPSPFPMTVFDNVAYGLRQHYRLSRSELSDRVEDALKRSALWDEVKHKLGEPGIALSGGQQQRLCIARCIATEPDVVLMDEPASAIDPVGDGEDRGAHGEPQGQLHDRHRDAQHAAGGAGQRLHRVLLRGPHRRVRSDDADLLEPAAEADRGLHHRPLQLSAGRTTT